MMRAKSALSGAVLALALLCSTQTTAAESGDVVKEGRTWLYANLTGVLSPHWSYTVMPGIRYEFSDSLDEAGGVVMYEFFTGPSFRTNLGPVTFVLPLWYYYMGFPVEATGDYLSSHNLELVPIFRYGLGNWSFMSRTIFHNKLYADNPAYTTDSQRNGYSLLVRQMLRVGFALSPKWSLTVADEIFVGLVEDDETNDIRKGEPFFEKQGFSMNRVYAGFAYTVAPGLSVSPQYILETHHDPDNDHDLTRIRHYLFVTFNYAMKMF